MPDRKEFFYPLNSKNDNTSTASLFESRKFFAEFSVPYITGQYLYDIQGLDSEVSDLDSAGTTKKTKIPLSDLYNQNAFYGMIDNDGDIVNPIENISNFKAVGKSGIETIYLLDFISDAFTDMKKYLNNQLLKGCQTRSSNLFNINLNTSPFYNMSITKSYKPSHDIRQLYNANAFTIASKFRSYTLSDKTLNSSIKNFEDFIKKYIPFLKEHLLVSPVTKSRTMCFYNYKVFNNGITFAISNDNAGDDENKYTKFYSDPAFFSFAKACIRYGFRIDKNIPFILHADLDSPALQKYANKYGMYDVNSIFRNRFTKMFNSDVYSIREFFINSYNSFLIENKTYELISDEPCGNAITTKYINRIDITDGTRKEFPIWFWARVYLYFKILELKPGFSQENFEAIYNITKKYLQTGQREKAFSYINSYFNELNGVHFFDSLLVKKDVVELESVGYKKIRQPDLLF